MEQFYVLKESPGYALVQTHSLCYCFVANKSTLVSLHDVRLQSHQQRRITRSRSNFFQLKRNIYDALRILQLVSRRQVRIELGAVVNFRLCTSSALNTVTPHVLTWHLLLLKIRSSGQFPSSCHGTAEEAAEEIARDAQHLVRGPGQHRARCSGGGSKTLSRDINALRLQCMFSKPSSILAGVSFSCWEQANTRHCFQEESLPGLTLGMQEYYPYVFYKIVLDFDARPGIWRQRHVFLSCNILFVVHARNDVTVISNTTAYAFVRPASRVLNCSVWILLCEESCMYSSVASQSCNESLFGNLRSFSLSVE